MLIQSQPCFPPRIQDFLKKLHELSVDVHLDPADFQECQQVHRNLSLCLNFYDKFIKIWDSLAIVDRSLSFASAE